MTNIGALFDLDGVVIDSESVYTEFWDGVDKIYPSGIDNFAVKIKGSTLSSILDTYYPQPDRQTHILQLIRKFESEMRYTPFPEAIRFIRELRESHIPCAVVTSSAADKMDALYLQNPGFKDLFDAIITGDMVNRSKPDPEPYLIGARSIGVEITNCFVFEDSIAGLESGRNAGATVIGLATTLPAKQIDGKAHKAIPDFMGFHIKDMILSRK